MRHALLPLLALLAAPLAAQQPTAAAPRSVAGCYTLELGRWTPALGASPAHALPARVVLDTAAAAGAPGSFRVLPAAGGAASHDAASWSPLPFKPDSLRIRWATGGAGVDARLRAGVGELRGRATAFTAEAPRGIATAPLVARRTPDCALGAAAAVSGATELAGLEARGTPARRDPADAPETPGEPGVEAARIPPPPPAPPGRAEQIAGYTVLGVMVWLLVNFTGIL